MDDGGISVSLKVVKRFPFVLSSVLNIQNSDIRKKRQVESGPTNWKFFDIVEKRVRFYYVWSPEHSVSAKGTRGLGDLPIFLCLIMWKSESWSEAKSIEANRRSAFLC